MQPETDAPSIQRVTFDWIDTQSVFRVYAVITCCIGVGIMGTGIRGIPSLPLPHASLVWIAGMILIAAGCAGSGLALNDDPAARRRALFRFAGGHVLLGLIVWMQWGVYWHTQGLPVLVALAPLMIGIGLVAVALVAPPADGQATSPRKLRSSYETHIRQLARREERARLARDLHDAVKQQLFVIQTAAATVQARLDHDAAGAQTALEHVRTAAREATMEMEALLEELQAAPMENTGLVEALRKQCDALAFRTGATVSFEPGPLPPQGRLMPGSHEAIYRVAQEALANVARHARATRVSLSIAATATGFELRVADNGGGFDPSTIRRGMGMANMEARAAEIGGRLVIAGTPSGTEVRLSLPVTRDMLSAWGPVRLVGLLLLFTVVFYGIRGHAPEQPGLLILELAGIWAILNLAAAYRRRSRSRSR
jgi:signal transduction histidine kinase